MITIVLSCLIPLLMAVIYFLGLKTGKELSRQEKPIKQAKLTKEEKKEQAQVIETFNKAWDNINNYDGTSMSQKEVTNDN